MDKKTPESSVWCGRYRPSHTHTNGKLADLHSPQNNFSLTLNGSMKVKVVTS